MTRLVALRVPGDAARWVGLGLSTDDAGRFTFANGGIEVGADTTALEVDDIAGVPADVDGVALVTGLTASRDPAIDHRVDHPNGAFEIDHIVVMTDSLERTSAAIDATLGLEQRRLRETPTVRQAFHRFADEGGSRGCIIEVVETDRVTAPAIWGVVLNVSDPALMESVAGDSVGAFKPAVQPGRQISTVRREAGVGLAVAFMTA